MGYKISAEDYKRLFSNFSSLTSGGAAVTAKKGLFSLNRLKEISTMLDHRIKKY